MSGLNLSVVRKATLALSLVSCAASALELPMPEVGNDLAGQLQTHIARYEDTFADLGTARDLGYLELIAANPSVDAWLPGEGTEILLPTRYILPQGPRNGMVINLPEYRMYYYAGASLHTYPLGIGREGWESPVANTKVTAKTPNPAWYPPKSIRQEHAAEGDYLPTVVPAGPDNPLGPYKFTLGLPGYLIHGSNKKFGIGMRVSHGCFRMLNHNVLELAKMAPVGTAVRIINEPYKFGVSHGKLYLEAHAPLEEDGLDTLEAKQAKAVNGLLANNALVNAFAIDWDAVRAVVAAQEGIPIEVGVANSHADQISY